MKSPKASRRAILRKVEVLSVTQDGRPRTQAKVALAYGDQQAVGRVFVPPDDEEMLQSVALATLRALRDLIPNEVSFVLKSAIKLRPNFLDDPLIVVIVDCRYDDLELNLTGACITKDEKLITGVASAILDATNRLVSYLVESEAQKEDS
jgi:hypothetical protein